MRDSFMDAKLHDTLCGIRRTSSHDNSGSASIVGSAHSAMDTVRKTTARRLGLPEDKLFPTLGAKSVNNEVNYRPAGQQWPVCTP